MIVCEVEVTLADVTPEKSLFVLYSTVQLDSVPPAVQLTTAEVAVIVETVMDVGLGHAIAGAVKVNFTLFLYEFT